MYVCIYIHIVQDINDITHMMRYKYYIQDQVELPKCQQKKNDSAGKRLLDWISTSICHSPFFLDDQS